jgi:hypothetical protein
VGQARQQDACAVQQHHGTQSWCCRSSSTSHLCRHLSHWGGGTLLQARRD